MKRHHDIVSKVVEKTTLDEMKNSAEKEKEIAIEKGHVDKDGIPCITVVGDDSWSNNRSYRSKYNALSGTAAVMGLQTASKINFA